MNVLIYNKQLSNIVKDDLQKKCIELAQYKIDVGKNKYIKNKNYEKELINDIKFLNVLMEDFTISKFKNHELIEIPLNNNFLFNYDVNDLRNRKIRTCEFFLIFILSSVASFFLLSTSPFILPISCLPWLVHFSVRVIPIIPFLWKNISFKIKKFFIKIKNKKINNKNKYAKNKKISNILHSHKVKEKDYSFWKNNYLNNLYKKITKNKENVQNFDSNIKKSANQQYCQSTSGYKSFSHKL